MRERGAEHKSKQRESVIGLWEEDFVASLSGTSKLVQASLDVTEGELEY